MTLKPMLSKTANPKQIEQYLTDPEWYLQQKLDGIRILIDVDGGTPFKDATVTGWSRSGKQVDLADEATAPFVHLEGHWVFDGEFVGTGDDGVLWLFDLPYAGTHIVTPNDRYAFRAESLTATYDRILKDSPDIRLVDMARTPEEKRALWAWCHVVSVEGVMLKRASGKYLSGGRSLDCLKLKFTETVDVVILEVGREGKESVAVGAYHGGVMTDIGSVKMTTSQGLNKAKVGDVIEVRYLYVDKGMRLLQPVFLKFRPDKKPEDCNTDQLKYTNREVHDGKRT